jgi:hypothetical protein
MHFLTAKVVEPYPYPVEHNHRRILNYVYVSGFSARITVLRQSETRSLLRCYVEGSSQAQAGPIRRGTGPEWAVGSFVELLRAHYSLYAPAFHRPVLTIRIQKAGVTGSRPNYD